MSAQNNILENKRQSYTNSGIRAGTLNNYEMPEKDAFRGSSMDRQGAGFRSGPENSYYSSNQARELEYQQYEQKEIERGRSSRLSAEKKSYDRNYSKAVETNNTFGLPNQKENKQMLQLSSKGGEFIQSIKDMDNGMQSPTLDQHI